MADGQRSERLRLPRSTSPGHWFNDPNGLIFLDGAYRLFVQHSQDQPNLAERNWARLSSDDLLRWQFDGPVLSADALGSRYSGSIIPGAGGLEAFLTIHDPSGYPRQRQVRIQGSEAGARWSSRYDSLGPSGRNIRDPFVWLDGDGVRRMLVAHPGDWAAGARGEASFLSLWSETPGGGFVQSGTIGPWHAPGILWEVPAVLDFGATQALLISLVDRRGEATRCSVRYWLGEFAAQGFTLRSGFPAEGLLLDPTSTPRSPTFRRAGRNRAAWSSHGHRTGAIRTAFPKAGVAGPSACRDRCGSRAIACT